VIEYSAHVRAWPPKGVEQGSKMGFLSVANLGRSCGHTPDSDLIWRRLVLEVSCQATDQQRLRKI
jgi:hypothetical protein